MTLRLVDLEAPLEDVEFPDGTTHQPVPFGAAEYKLWREQEQETDIEKRGAMRIAILRACHPTATDENFLLCTPVMLLALIAHAARKIDQVRAALKNAVGRQEEAPTPPTPPLSPTTSGATSSPTSPRKRARTGGASTTVSRTASHT